MKKSWVLPAALVLAAAAQAVLVTGAIHGDELSSASVALHWIRLAAGEQVQMPQPVHWRFVPMLNPDGLDQVGIFPGSLGNCGGVHKGVPVVTIELPNAMRTPLDAEMRQMWLDLLRWMVAKIPVEGR